MTVQYGPANNTDRWQPIDARFGRLVKESVKAKYTAWWNEYVYFVFIKVNI